VRGRGTGRGRNRGRAWARVRTKVCTECAKCLQPCKQVGLIGDPG